MLLDSLQGSRPGRIHGLNDYVQYFSASTIETYGFSTIDIGPIGRYSNYFLEFEANEVA